MASMQHGGSEYAVRAVKQFWDSHACVLSTRVLKALVKLHDQGHSADNAMSKVTALPISKLTPA